MPRDPRSPNYRTEPEVRPRARKHGKEALKDDQTVGMVVEWAVNCDFA
jgi:hypothetical protein